jgi:hypothetical protein
MALQSIAAAELSKNQHLRDFWWRSIFDFCNTIMVEADASLARLLGGVPAATACSASTGDARL